MTRPTMRSENKMLALIQSGEEVTDEVDNDFVEDFFATIVIQ